MIVTASHYDNFANSEISKGGHQLTKETCVDGYFVSYDNFTDSEVSKFGHILTKVTYYDGYCNTRDDFNNKENENFDINVDDAHKMSDHSRHMLTLASLIAILIDRMDDYVDLLILTCRHVPTPYFNINFSINTR